MASKAIGRDDRAGRCAIRRSPKRLPRIMESERMGRPSKLTEKQWTAIGERLLKGEKAADLAREFGVSKTRISERFSKSLETVKAVANQLVTAEAALRALPIAEQVSVLNYADDLRAVSAHLIGAAKYGSATAHRLAGIAHANVLKIDDAAPLDGDSMETLRGVAALTKLANDASQIGVNLLNANKEAVREMNAPDLSRKIDAIEMHIVAPALPAA